MQTNSTNDWSSQKLAVIFTANYKGGVLQFSIRMTQAFEALGYRTVLFVPDNAEIPSGSEIAAEIVRFARFKNLRIHNAHSTVLADKIAAYKPALTLFCDDTISTTQTLSSLGRRCRTMLVIHDINPHPQNVGIRLKLQIKLESFYRRMSLKNVDDIIVLSSNSQQKFRELHRGYRGHVHRLLLGAHVPAAVPVKPSELLQKERPDYYLFFGRLDKYKGIARLLQAYETFDNPDKPELIIAGDGNLTTQEVELIQSNQRVTLIRRYIDDGEMIWLIQNARAIALPYTEASQSGVLPMAYHFGVPVITSDVKGLVEFVDDGKTGIICPDVLSMTQALECLSDDNLRATLSAGAQKFSNRMLNWEENLRKCLDTSGK